MVGTQFLDVRGLLLMLKLPMLFAYVSTPGPYLTFKVILIRAFGRRSRNYYKVATA